MVYVPMNASEKKSTAVLGSIFALRMLGLFMIVPVMSIYGKQYTGWTPQLLGLAVGVYGLAQACFQLPFGMLADRMSRRPLIVFGLLLFVFGSVVCALSHSIMGIIVGRAIAGAGAVSAVVMALLSDVVRDEQRTYAMAVMGMSIALSFIVAFSLGPLLIVHVGFSGLFWLCACAGIVAMCLLWIVPVPVRAIPQFSRRSISGQSDYVKSLMAVLRHRQLAGLHAIIFIIHVLLTAIFVLLPAQLITLLNIDVYHHGWVYLGVLLTGFGIAIPLIILAETHRWITSIVRIATLCLPVGLLLMALASWWAFSLLVGFALFITAFNSLEALLPSWLVKIAPLEDKATAMGVNATSQFFGAFCGGALGGWLLQSPSVEFVWIVLALLSLCTIISAYCLRRPAYCRSINMSLPERFKDMAKAEGRILLNQVLTIEGIVEAMLFASEQSLYLKIDQTKFDDHARQKLEMLIALP